jgi:hypothetical protein
MALTKVRSSGLFTDFNNGVVVVDQYRLTASFTTDSATVTGWEQNDDSSFSNLGTSMTEASGIFTFPSAGLYLIFYFGNGTNGSGDNTMSVQTQISTDSGSTYDLVAGAISGSAGQNYSVSSEAIVNVTDASTFRCRFFTNSMASGTAVYGDTNYNRTAVTFIRLADSQ